MSVLVVRAFVRLRQTLALNAQLARKLDALEKTYDAQFKVVFDAIRQLMTLPEPKKRKIGFLVEEKAASYGRRKIVGLFFHNYPSCAARRATLCSHAWPEDTPRRTFKELGAGLEILHNGLFV
jgi:hypothetical protein